MKYSAASSSRLLSLSALTMASIWIVGSSHAAPIYWDGTSAGWDSTANWSTDSVATTPDPTVVPGSSDDAVFNISTVSGAETVSLNAAQATNSLTFNNTGTTLINTGTGTNTLTLGSGGLTKAAGSGVVTISSDIVIGANQSWTNNSIVSSAVIISGNITGSANLDLNVSTSQRENGSFTLSGSNNSGYSGNISISNGRVATSNANSFGTGTVTVNSGAQAYFGQGVTYTNNIVVSGVGYGTGSAQPYALRTDANTVLSGTITVAGSASLSSHNRASTYSGQLTSTGAGDVTFISNGGAGTITLSNTTNNWAGTTTINNDTLKLGASDVLPNGTTITFSNGTAILDLNGQSETVDLLSSTGTSGFIQNSTASTTATFTIGGGSAASASFGGVIRNNSGTGGTVALTKAGSGTQTLTNTNTYTGATLINAGVLALTGTGSINATSGISVANGATFSNSSSATVTAALNLTEGSILAGTGSFTPSAMTVTANLSDGLAAITAGSTLTKAGTLTFSLTGITAGTYSLFSGLPSGSYTGVSIVSTVLNTADANATFTGTDGTWNYTFTNANNQLQVSAIPEPSTYASILGALALAGVVWKRRQKRTA